VTDRRLAVYLDGTLCGHITQTSGGNLSFAYDPEYRVSTDATPLSLSMPLAATTHKKRAILPFLQGLLPDSEDALRAMSRRYSVSANSPFALLEHVGADVAGAVQIMRPGESASDRDLSRTEVRTVSDDDIATMLDHVVSEYSEGVPYTDVVGRFSLAGAQPKIALHRLANGTWGVPEDATPTTHILKPVVGSFRRLDVVEQMTMHAASQLGNEVAQSALSRFGEWDVFVSERYDRAVAGDRWRRLHQEDLCQALSVSPAKKYQHRDGGPGLAEVARLIRSLPFESDRRLVGERFYRAFVFNIVAGATDAPAKNYSLMLDGAAVRLAPLYDLATYAAYWDGTARIDSAMKVGDEYALSRIGARQLAAAGNQFGVPADAADDIVDGVRRGLLEAFESARAEIEVHGKGAREVADALISGVRRLPLVLTGESR
jgi:serine/threonine-protein kinase HipA